MCFFMLWRRIYPPWFLLFIKVIGQLFQSVGADRDSHALICSRSDFVNKMTVRAWNQQTGMMRHPTSDEITTLFFILFYLTMIKITLSLVDIVAVNLFQSFLNFSIYKWVIDLKMEIEWMRFYGWNLPQPSWKAAIQIFGQLSIKERITPLNSI